MSARLKNENFVSTAYLKESGGGAHGLAVSGDNADALLVI
jgi:hypothetical protein